MTILFFADYKHNHLSSDSLKALAAAFRFGKEIDIFLVGEHSRDENDPLFQNVQKFPNIRKILYTYDEDYKHYLAEPIAQELFSLRENYDIFITAANNIGKNIFPRLAALLDVMQISNVIEILDEKTFKRPIYTGNAIATIESNDPKKVITVQSAAFKKAETANNQAPIHFILARKSEKLSHFVAQEESQNKNIDLENAKIIVAGGRGLGSAEKFQKLLIPFAQKLQAAIGASRAAVDSGYAPNDWQIGQTGKIVAPDLYFAVGISGAMQHIAGMKDSRIIVAINNDPQAPIFQIADYGIIGDLSEVIDEMNKAL